MIIFMSSSAAGSPSHRRAWWPTVMGWAALACSYFVAVPVFGVLSPVTWTMAYLGWLGAILGPAYGALRSARIRGLTPTVMWWCLWVVLAVAILTMLRPPVLTVDDLYQRHRADLDQLAAEYRAEGIGEDRALPLRLRFLAVDGQAHLRCTSRDPDRGCGVYLMLWQDWRAEAGFGIAYFPVRPNSEVRITTASGDSGGPTRELGKGWWLVE
ncbi:hypothetical protein AB0J80_27285 [Actinoplanes sp. NPDC049548]|uniref:hypothetical protein n=1 Tax=Actinoplanes sp. NPDC049548 TaxID=3155152 RepID=UPI00341841D5